MTLTYPWRAGVRPSTGNYGCLVLMIKGYSSAIEILDNLENAAFRVGNSIPVKIWFLADSHWDPRAARISPWVPLVVSSTWPDLWGRVGTGSALPTLIWRSYSAHEVALNPALWEIYPRIGHRLIGYFLQDHVSFTEFQTATTWHHTSHVVPYCSTARNAPWHLPLPI